MHDPAGTLSTQIERLKALVAEAEIVAGFTGAGISTESGVPDFRSPNSPWMRNKPIPFEAFLASEEAAPASICNARRPLARRAAGS